MSDATATPETPELPAGDYAIVELLGHRTLIGRVAEVERFGTKLLQVEVIYQNRLLPPTLHHGNAVYGFTPCSVEIARQRQATRDYQLPPSLLATLPPEALAAPQQIEPFISDDHRDLGDVLRDELDVAGDDDEEPF